MKAKVTITLIIDDAQKYVDDQLGEDKDALRDRLESDIDEGNISIDDLMVQDDVSVDVFVAEHTEG
jgi:hypothetical protein